MIHPIPTPDEFLSADERKARLIDEAKRRSLVDGIAKELQAHYVSPEMATRMITALRDHLAHGDYDKITSGEEFAMTVTKDLRDVSHDLHLGLMFGRHPRGSGLPPLDAQRAMARAMNYGFGPIERMSGNVAHVVINGFPPIVDDETRKAVADLMSQVADADALVVDLRSNGVVHDPGAMGAPDQPGYQDQLGGHRCGARHSGIRRGGARRGAPTRPR